MFKLVKNFILCKITKNKKETKKIPLRKNNLWIETKTKEKIIDKNTILIFLNILRLFCLIIDALEIKNKNIGIKVIYSER